MLDIVQQNKFKTVWEKGNYRMGSTAQRLVPFLLNHIPETATINDYGFAEGFAEGEDSGTTFVAKIPIKYVFSTPLTGIGCTDEYEVVVVGHDIDIHVVNDIAIHKNSDFKKVNKFDDVIIMPGFETLKGAPEIVGGDFNCSYNSLKSLEGAPEIVGGNFDCAFNKKLKSLEGCPKEVGGDFYYSGPFTEEDIRKVCNVKGRVMLKAE